MTIESSYAGGAWIISRFQEIPQFFSFSEISEILAGFPCFLVRRIFFFHLRGHLAVKLFDFVESFLILAVDDALIDAIRSEN